VAGLILNVSEFVLNTVVLGNQMSAMMQKMNLPPMTSASMGIFVVLGFGLGISLVWLYAAIRARFGAGPKTAVYAGAAVWLFAYLYPSLGMVAMGMTSASMLLIGLSWGLVEVLVAAVAGGYVYRE